ncbi:MAG: ATP synthase subunit I [Planctomycetales bacterium]|nr:ATP synthase subunit I [Planctomycetales bacterium]
MSVADLTLAAAVGGILAILYFVGLWWTIRYLPKTRHPLAMYFTSLVARLSVTLLAFWLLIASFPWQSVASCLCGFMIGRMLLVHFTCGEQTSSDKPFAGNEADRAAIEVGGQK